MRYNRRDNLNSHGAETHPTNPATTLDSHTTKQHPHLLAQWRESRRYSSPHCLRSALPIDTAHVQRLASLRQEADNAVARAEEAEAKVKKLEQQQLEKDQDITSLQHKLSVADEQLEKFESKLTESKAQAQDAESNKATNEGLSRKVQLLEEELDAAEKHSKEVVEKCVPRYLRLVLDR